MRKYTTDDDVTSDAHPAVCSGRPPGGGSVSGAAHNGNGPSAEEATQKHIPANLQAEARKWAMRDAGSRKEKHDSAEKMLAHEAIQAAVDALGGGDGAEEQIGRALLALDAGKPIGQLAGELIRTTPPEPNWAVPGLAAVGWMVKFAAREKVGKGTLVFYLLGCLERHEPTVFGAAAAGPMSALICTEEPEDSVREKLDHAGLETALVIYGWELSHLDWPARVDYLVSRAAEGGHGVLFVDNLSRAASVADEGGVELSRAGEYLGDRARAAGLTTIIDHHHKKGAAGLADKSRGGTALAGACDNNIEMERVGPWDSRVRRLSSRGRLSSTIWTRLVALAGDARGYENVATADQPQTVKDRSRLRTLARFGDDGASAREFAEATEVANHTARDALDEFVHKGWATCVDARPKRWMSTGEGLASEPEPAEGGLEI